MRQRQEGVTYAGNDGAHLDGFVCGRGVWCFMGGSEAVACLRLLGECWRLASALLIAGGKVRVIERVEGREREGLLLFMEARRMEGSQGQDARCVWLHRHVDVCRTVREGPPHTCSSTLRARLSCESTNSGSICLPHTPTLATNPCHASCRCQSSF